MLKSPGIHQKTIPGMHFVCSIPVSPKEMRGECYRINYDGICFCLSKDNLRQLRNNGAFGNDYFHFEYSNSHLAVYKSNAPTLQVRFRENPLGEGIQKSQIFIFDTCFLASLFRSSFSLKTELSGILMHGDAVIPRQVLDELEAQRNSLRKGDKGVLLVPHEKFCELMCLIRDREWHGGKLSVEPVSLHNGYIRNLRSTLKDRSLSNNSRVGHADAAICHLSWTLSDLYDKIIVMSVDSDVHLLLSGREGIEVRFESMILDSRLQK